jgi:hypothetical protein
VRFTLKISDALRKASSSRYKPQVLVKASMSVLCGRTPAIPGTMILPSTVCMASGYVCSG